MKKRLILPLLVLALLIGTLPARAASVSPAQTAETLRAALFAAQMDFTRDPAESAVQLAKAEAAYVETLAAPLADADPAADARLRAGFQTLKTALADADPAWFAAARAQVWTALLAGSVTVVEQATRAGEVSLAQTWLPVREFRTATRFSRPSADATLALTDLAADTLPPEDALIAVRADLLDTYQARLAQALRDLTTADASDFSVRRAELAALAEGYFAILAPAYAEQRGPDALAATAGAFTRLLAAALAGDDLAQALEPVETALDNFRAAPLSSKEEARRAGQLLRYISLVPIEYGRGVANGWVTQDFEIQEAITFLEGAQAAFDDLESLLAAQDAAQTAQAAAHLTTLARQLNAALSGGAVADPADVKFAAEGATEILQTIMPEAWTAQASTGDFDVIQSLLDQLIAAVSTGDYEMAESSRLEAYAVMEVGPEAKLLVFAPQLNLTLEGLFWYGDDQQPGLGALIQRRAPLDEVRATRRVLDTHLAEAQKTLSASTAPAAIVTNAGVIVFREGLEAVLILASLLSSLKGVENARLRRPLWVGSLGALLATGVTWLLVRGVLLTFARFGEKLEAVVSLIAIGVLLVITNWFFHKAYWTNWLAQFHARKRTLLSGETGLWLGLAALGFTSVYREGFETVLFLQALVLEGGMQTVLLGLGFGVLATAVVGWITFRLQVNLPYKKMLIVTGIMIGVVLLVMVGNTVHVLQVVGWLPIHTIPWLPFPYWTGMWFGLFATWEGIGLQLVAAAFVVGSYYLAEGKRRR